MTALQPTPMPTTQTDPLAKEFEYFLANREEILKKFLGRVVIIKDRTVIGDYDSVPDALNDGDARFGRGNYLVQECSEDAFSFTRTFRSRFAPA